MIVYSYVNNVPRGLDSLIFNSDVNNVLWAGVPVCL
jgi:hypothetical protein